MMLYVLILYCTGFCPPSMAPADVLFYSSLADCKTERRKFGADFGPMIGAGGKLLRHTRERATCARMFAAPEQLDRILDPVKLEKWLSDNGVK